MRFICGLLNRSVAWQVVTGISEKYMVSIFGVKMGIALPSEALAFT